MLWVVLLCEAARERLTGALGPAVGETRSVLCFWAGLHDLGEDHAAVSGASTACFQAHA
ncbi:hypothetical protein [Streptomyces sp. CC224B]|uniref:hypothetical protein n=1 Tax=Streptomyces sp. CC224B TaxID=3044571 RepID=UPI0024A8135B|nr:hypothetical protein [Streptomyces sp. CC224B]